MLFIYKKKRKLKMTVPTLRKNLLKDKKGSGSGRVNFILLKGIGKPVKMEVKIEDIIKESRRQRGI